MTDIIRQGDLLFQRQRGRQDNGKPSEGRVLAYGEATGHAHQAEADSDVQLYCAEDGTVAAIAVNDDEVRIVHEEHGPATLTRGMWSVTRQREYDPDAVARERRVAD